jgi:hypothetical protein
MSFHTAVLVLNRNMREMTERLIDRIRESNTKYSMDIWCIDADSDQEEVVTTSDQVFMLYDNPRWAKAFNIGLIESQHFGHMKGTPYSHFWCVCNDAQMVDDEILATLIDGMPDDCAQIHPYQMNHPRDSFQGRFTDGGVRASSYVEFVCPLLSRTFIERAQHHFGFPGIDPDFPMGWGVDYVLPYTAHYLGFKSYLSDDVGIIHEPGTTHANHVQAKVESNEDMRKKARNTMLDVLEQKYGKDWGLTFSAAASGAGVDPRAFLDWSHYDRSLSETGARA